MSRIFGYCRISTKKQSIDRQERNILSVYPTATILKETYTGTAFQGRKILENLIRIVEPNDTIVFDSVSRMSRNSEEGFQLYEQLFNYNVNLVFIKEPHINTDTYKEALTKNLKMTGTNVDFILEGINKYLLTLAKEQIHIAFEQAEKEVRDLRQRTKEGIVTARISGKPIGRQVGTTFETKKSIFAKQEILKKSTTFGGNYSDIDLIKILRISRNSYYKYKRQLLSENNAQST